jgi:dihydropteroate synthase
VQNTGFSTNKTLNLNGRLLILDPPIVMGILNVTPDSFYDGGKHSSELEILKKTERMLSEGAKIIDVGGYSSRPGASDVPEDEELSRVCQAIQVIVKRFPEVNISVDTFRSAVARAANAEGAAMVNDISGGTDPKMFSAVAELKIPYVLMHMKGTPQTMTQHASYTDLLAEIREYFHKKIGVLRELGVNDIIIDPGFGFAKTREHNFEILNKLEEFQIFGLPVLAGLSRKSMVWKTLDQRPEDALNGTSVLNTVAILKGASICRVHDVKECVEAIRLINAMKETEQLR